LKDAPALSGFDKPWSFRNAFDALGFDPWEQAALMGAHTFGKITAMACYGQFKGVQKGPFCNKRELLDPPVSAEQIVQNGCRPGKGMANQCWKYVDPKAKKKGKGKGRKGGSGRRSRRRKGGSGGGRKRRRKERKGKGKGKGSRRKRKRKGRKGGKGKGSLLEEEEEEEEEEEGNGKRTGKGRKQTAEEKEKAKNWIKLGDRPGMTLLPSFVYDNTRYEPTAAWWGGGAFWDTTPTKFDNDYYRIMADEKFGNRNNCCGSSCNHVKGTMRNQRTKVEYGPCDVSWCRHKHNGKDFMKSTRAWAEPDHNFVRRAGAWNPARRMIRLAGDWALLGHNETRAAAQAYAADQDKFFEAFDKAFSKVLSKGQDNGNLKSCSAV